jgi:hypothetical protein
MGIGNTYEGQPGLRRNAPGWHWWPAEVDPMSSQVELCEHHAKDCLQAAERAEGRLARERFVDAKQRRDRAWYIEAAHEPSLRKLRCQKKHAPSECCRPSI